MTVSERGNDPLIHADRVAKNYRAGDGSLVALEEVTFSAGRGDFVAIVGPSGCGKSTLLNIVGGILPATSGQVTVAGAPIDGPRREIGMMFQRPILFPWRTVLDNMLLPIEIFGLDKRAHRERAREIIQLVGLSEFEGTYPGQLSGGMQQRVALGRTLIFDPAVLLMDEPFGALDEFTRESLNLELLRICATTRTTTLFVTHNIGEAVFLADRVLVMTPRPGRLVRTLEVAMERPRDRSVMLTPAFQEHVFEIRELLGVAR